MEKYPGLEDGPEGQSTCYSHRGPEFGSQKPYEGAHSCCDSGARSSNTSDCCGHLHADPHAHTQPHSPASNQKEQKQIFKKRSGEYSCIPGNSSMRVLLNKTTAHVLIDLFGSAPEIIHKAL